MQAAAPVAPTTPAWDAAFLRVESYLRAHHIESRVLLNHLAAEIIRQAREVADGVPDEEIVGLAMRIAHAQIGHWFARVYPEGDWNEESFRARGRLALLLTDMPGRWPERFLAAEPLPEELAEEMRTRTFRPGPELRFTNMPPTSLDDIFGDEPDPARAPATRLPMLRALFASLLVVGIIGIAWASSL